MRCFRPPSARRWRTADAAASSLLWACVFCARTMPSGDRGGIRLAFADTGGERRALSSLLLTSLLVGAGGLTAFFFISLFLSHWVLRPVKNAFEQQRQFIADASHELKTPLTVILANTNILSSHRTEPIEQQIKWVDSVHEEAQRMKRLVDDLLFLARADAGRTPMCSIR